MKAITQKAAEMGCDKPHASFGPATLAELWQADNGNLFSINEEQ